MRVDKEYPMKFIEIFAKLLLVIFGLLIVLFVGLFICGIFYKHGQI